MPELKNYKKARIFKGLCEVCQRCVQKGDFYTTSGTDGHGALTNLRHKGCSEGKPWWEVK